MHGAERQAVWVAGRAGQGCKVYQRGDRQWRHPVTEMSRQRLSGDKGQRPLDHCVAASWQILYASSQLRWCLFICKGRVRLADCAAIHALRWPGGRHTQIHTVHSYRNLVQYVCVGVWWGKREPVRQTQSLKEDSIKWKERGNVPTRGD